MLLELVKVVSILFLLCFTDHIKVFFDALSTLDGHTNQRERGQLTGDDAPYPRYYNCSRFHFFCEKLLGTLTGSGAPGTS